MVYAANEIPLSKFEASRWGDNPAKTIDAFRRILEHEMDGYGGVIAGEAGKYLLPEPVEIDKPVTIRGQGKMSTYIEQAPDVLFAPLLFGPGANGAGLDAVYVRGNGLGPGVMVTGANDVDLHKAAIVGAYDGLVVNGPSHRLNISHTLIANNRHHGIAASGGFSHGIYVDVTCQVHSNGHHPKPGDDLGDNFSIWSSAENIILGNSWDAAGMIARFGAAGQNIMIATNLNSCGRSAISLEAGSSANRIEVGLIYDPGLLNRTGADWPAIRLVDSHDNVIHGFTVEYRVALPAAREAGAVVREIGQCSGNSIGAIKTRYLAA